MNTLNTALNLFSENMAVACFAGVLIVSLLLEVSTLSKRHLRKGELGHFVILIRNPHGESDSIRLFWKCVHLSRVYFIPLSQVGVKGGRKELMREAFKSQRLAEDRERRTLENVVLPEIGNLDQYKFRLSM